MIAAVFYLKSLLQWTPYYFSSSLGRCILYQMLFGITALFPWPIQAPPPSPPPWPSMTLPSDPPSLTSQDTGPSPWSGPTHVAEIPCHMWLITLFSNLGAAKVSWLWFHLGHWWSFRNENPGAGLKSPLRCHHRGRNCFQALNPGLHVFDADGLVRNSSDDRRLSSGS